MCSRSIFVTTAIVGFSLEKLPSLSSASTTIHLPDPSFALLSKEDILKQLEQKNVSCQDVTFKIFGLSLTTYNILISLVISISTAKIYFNYDKS